MQYFTDTDMGLDIGQVNMAVESAFTGVPPAGVNDPEKVFSR